MSLCHSQTHQYPSLLLKWTFKSGIKNVVFSEFGLRTKKIEFGQMVELHTLFSQILGIRLILLALMKKPLILLP
ncbi:hypothetical protein SAMN05444359_12875 [Neolewinella agarilytica]|uniref:Uncharacterized protein n=1 Tax=Neolewinella agarilytica TaxID=478744 RepID=A0A1H9MEU6_9BACT|nr:hypothetical protein SAMN05444359_12875 [Neolewinella agarilytica]